MCTVSSAREVHVWVLHERLPITVLQSVSYQLQGEVPYTVCFFEHRHKGFTENDVELFEYRMVVGTEKSLLFFDVRESYANFDLFDPTNSSGACARARRRRVAPSADVARSAQSSRSARARSCRKSSTLRCVVLPSSRAPRSAAHSRPPRPLPLSSSLTLHTSNAHTQTNETVSERPLMVAPVAADSHALAQMMMKRTLTRRTQNRRQFKDKVNPELNFLSVALAQKQSMLRELGGVRSLAMIEFDEPGEHEHRRGCHVVIVGGFGIEQRRWRRGGRRRLRALSSGGRVHAADGRTLSPVHAVTLNETGGREPFSCHANSLTEHFGLVHSVCGLSKRVRSNLDGFLGDEELLAVSGSFDESVRLTKFSVSLDANEFRAAKKAGDKVLVLERPLTEFQAKRLFALQEAAQSAVTDRPFPQRGDLSALLVARPRVRLPPRCFLTRAHARARAAVVDAQLKKAAGAAGGVAGLSSLSVFRDTALIGAGQVPAKPVEVKGPQAPRAEHHAQHGHRGHHHGHHGHHGHHEQHGHHKHAAAAPHEGVRGASKLTSFEKFAKKKEEAEKSKQRMCKNTCVVM